MTVKERTVILTPEDIASSRMSEYRISELKEALELAGYHLVVASEPNKAND